MLDHVSRACRASATTRDSRPTQFWFDKLKNYSGRGSDDTRAHALREAAVARARASRCLLSALALGYWSTWRRLLRVRRLFAFDAGLPSAGQRVDVILVEVYVHTSAQLPRYVAAISFVLQATLYFKTCPRTCRDHSCDDETCKSALQLAWHNAKAQGSPAASSRNFSLAEAGGARVRRSSFRRGR